ncbi:dihydrodipicolinate synthase family protein [Streptomyces sp. NPDC048172]|uniref:dihydrodipicolinate synthase family protein n=1 Tax=Streptomyces sp. NPDC048172 TaxID=3365505 RepID=UPI00371D6EA7
MTTSAPLGPPEGIHVPLITPFTSDDRVAVDALAALARSVLDAGAVGLVALGTTGEPSVLTAGERREVVEVCATVCRERGATLTVGAGSNDTRGTAEELRALHDSTPDAGFALVPVPPYTRPSEDGVVAHFTHLSAHSPLPMLVYDIPYRTGLALSPATLRRLAALPGVAGTKRAVGSLDATSVDLLADPPPDFTVLGGDDLYASPMMALGAAGGILASAHLCTGLWAELAAAWRDGDAVRARAAGRLLAPLAASLFAEPNPAVTKAVLHARGLIPTPAVRLPLLAATPTATATALTRLNSTESLRPPAPLP